MHLCLITLQQLTWNMGRLEVTCVTEINAQIFKNNLCSVPEFKEKYTIRELNNSGNIYMKFWKISMSRTLRNICENLVQYNLFILSEIDALQH